MVNRVTPDPDAAEALIARLHWPHPLFAYQRAGIAALAGNQGLLLADEMGLGKTIQAIAALRCLRALGETLPALVVAPAGLLMQWRAELHLWAPDLVLSTVAGSAADRSLAWRRAADVYVVGFDTLRHDAHRPDFAGRAWGSVVLDEAQRIRNRETDAARIVKRLPRTRSWALTGTPLENRVDDLISILEFVAPGRFDPRQYMLGLRKLLAEVQLRRRRAEVLHDLPAKLVRTITLPLSPAQLRTYSRAEQDGIFRLRALGSDVRISHVLELILRLKQICNFCPETGASAKLDDLLARLDRVVEAGERALVFSQFSAEPFGARTLERELARYRPLVLTGDVPVADRAALIAEFQHGSTHPVLILSLRAGGVGLNLTAASQVFHFDRWWNPAVETQAEDRAHRIGQHRPVQVHAYLTASTIEERVAEILAGKRALFDNVVEGVTWRGLARLDLETLLRAVDPGLGRAAPRSASTG
jgi:SNF2 family DNA or RNA helicase